MNIVTFGPVYQVPEIRLVELTLEGIICSSLEEQPTESLDEILGSWG